MKHSLAYVTGPHLSSAVANLAYKAELESDFDNGEINCTDPRAYAAKFKTYNKDKPSYNMAMAREFSVEYQQVMVKEIRQLLKQNTWCSVPRSSVSKGKAILLGTWVFKLKRLSDETKSKFKSIYYVRGDKQIEGVDYFDTYASVIQWSTIRWVLTMVLVNN